MLSSSPEFIPGEWQSEYENELTAMRQRVARYIGSGDRTSRDNSASEFAQVEYASEDDDYEVVEGWFESDPDSDGPLVGIETNPGWDRRTNMFDALNTLNEFEDGEGKNYEKPWSGKLGSIKTPGKSRHSNPKMVDEPFIIEGPVCNKCGRVGHRETSCNLYNSGKPVCNKCGKVGHSTRFCAADKKCNLCGKLGHIAKNCKTSRHWQVKANRSGSELRDALKDLTDLEAGTRDALREAVDEKREIEHDLGPQTGDDAYYRAKEEAVMAKKAAEEAEALQREVERIDWIRRKAGKLSFKFNQFVPYLDWRKIVLAVLAGVILFFLVLLFLASQSLLSKVSPWVAVIPFGGALAASLFTVFRTFVSTVWNWTIKQLYSRYEVNYEYSISEILKEEHDDDRPESHKARDMLYVNPIYARYCIQKSSHIPYTPVFSDNSFEEVRVEAQEYEMSIEAFMQMCNPKIMAAGRESDLVFEALNNFAGSLHSVNFSRGKTLKMEDILQQTVDFAHGYYLSQSQKREVIAPFLSRHLN